MYRNVRWNLVLKLYSTCIIRWKYLVYKVKDDSKLINWLNRRGEMGKNGTIIVLETCSS